MPQSASVAGCKQTHLSRQPCVSRVCGSSSLKIDFHTTSNLHVLDSGMGGGLGVQLFLEMASRCRSYGLILKFLEHFLMALIFSVAVLPLAPNLYMFLSEKNTSFWHLKLYLFICVCMCVYTHACYVCMLWCICGGHRTTCGNCFFSSWRFQGSNSVS